MTERNANVGGVASVSRGVSGAGDAVDTAARAPRAKQKTDLSVSYVSRSLLAGGLAGCMAKTAVAPLDRVKLLFQGSNSSVSRFSGSMIGAFRAVHWIGQEQGIRGIYKGHQATLLRIFPYAALNYMCYEQYKRVSCVRNLWAAASTRFASLLITHCALTVTSLPSSLQVLRHQQMYPFQCASETDLPPVIRLLAGSAAGLTSVFFTYPLDYVHSRIAYQVKETRYKGVLDTLRLTVQEAGIKGLYRQAHDTPVTSSRADAGLQPGLTFASHPSVCSCSLLSGGFGATALGIIPYAGMSFFTYDTLKHLASEYYEAQHRLAASTDATSAGVPVGVRLMCGALAGSAAQTAAYPLDVIRRRMQLYGLSSQLPKYRNTLHALVSIVRQEGVKRLYIGLSINYIKVGPAHAISFVCYETLKEWLHIK